MHGEGLKGKWIIPLSLMCGMEKAAKVLGGFILLCNLCSSGGNNESKSKNHKWLPYAFFMAVETDFKDVFTFRSGIIVFI